MTEAGSCHFGIDEFGLSPDLVAWLRCAGIGGTFIGISKQVVNVSFIEHKDLSYRIDWRLRTGRLAQRRRCSDVTCGTRTCEDWRRLSSSVKFEVNNGLEVHVDAQDSSQEKKL